MKITPIPMSPTSARKSAPRRKTGLSSMLSLPRFTSAWIVAIGSLALWPAVSVAAGSVAAGSVDSASPAEVVPAERQQIEAGAVPDGLEKSDWASIREAYEAGQHAFRPGDEGWVAHNPGQ
jgi:hypothetical protein